MLYRRYPLHWCASFVAMLFTAFSVQAQIDHEHHGSFSLQADTYTHGAEVGNVKTTDNIIELYGRLFMSATYNFVSHSDEEISSVTDDGHEETSDRFAFLSSSGSRFGIRGHKTINMNLNVFWQIESAVDLTNLGLYDEETHFGNTSEFAGRDSFIGFATEYGNFVFGKHNSPYKLAIHSWDPFNHILGDIRAIFGRVAGLSTRFDHHNNIYHTRIPNSILYFSPSKHGFSFNIAAGDIDETKRKQLPILSLNLKYRLGMMDFVYGFEQHWDVDQYQEEHDGESITIDSSNAHVFGAMLHFGNTMASVIGERIKFSDDTYFDGWVRYAWQVAVTHKIEHHSLRFAYTQSSKFYDIPDYAKMYAAGWFYSLADKTQVYLTATLVYNEAEAQYGNFMSDNFEHDNDVKTVSAGFIHAF